MRLRRFFRFRLFSLLIVFTVLALWMGYVARKADQQRKTISLFDQQDLYYAFDYQCQPNESGIGNVNGQLDVYPWLRNTLGDEYFREIGYVRADDADAETLRTVFICTNLLGLRVSSDHLTDDDFHDLRKLRDLIDFGVNSPNLSGEMLQYLSNPLGLRRLSIESPRLTDAALRHIRKCENLRGLTLGGGNITSRGISEVAMLRQLRVLVIYDIKVSDESWKMLETIPKLDHLSVYRVELTDEGLAAIGRIPTLRQLRVISCGCDAEDLRQLNSSTTLETVVFSHGDSAAMLRFR